MDGLYYGYSYQYEFKYDFSYRIALLRVRKSKLVPVPVVMATRILVLVRVQQQQRVASSVMRHPSPNCFAKAWRSDVEPQAHPALLVESPGTGTLHSPRGSTRDRRFNLPKICRKFVQR
eukprot:scaffold534252_cov38-Prasinocladus_malaysianus.AAC.1